MRSFRTSNLTIHFTVLYLHLIIIASVRLFCKEVSLIYFVRKLEVQIEHPGSTPSLPRYLKRRDYFVLTPSIMFFALEDVYFFKKINIQKFQKKSVKIIDFE
jgi:hypothetical protein